jgi:parallel beta-helix repeat protein
MSPLAVPWESLKAGDTVRFFYQATPYRTKFLIAARGTASQPVRICGVPGPNGERPIIDGANAITRTQIPYSTNFDPSNGLLHQTRSIIVIKPRATDVWEYFPQYITIDGLEIRGATPTNTFTDTLGHVDNYVSFGACIWVERGHNITIANNTIHDCTNGIFSKSTDDAFDVHDATEYSVSKDIRIAGNYIYGNGVVGDDHEHDTYIQSVNVVYEFNRYGPQRPNANGSALKDRSVNAVIRFNRIDGAARSLDLVEAEDYPETALSYPGYRSTFVYGNQIVKDGTTGIAIHYGGDHEGSESIYRKGTLYFFNNTLELTGSSYQMYAFQLSTTQEHAEIWNNVLMYRDSVLYPSLRGYQDVAPGYQSGGTINLGRNWINPNWWVTDPDHAQYAPGIVTGQANMLSSATFPVDMASFVPLAGSQAVDTGLAGPAAANAYPVNYQLDASFGKVPRAVVGSAIDLGALERP